MLCGWYFLYLVLMACLMLLLFCCFFFLPLSSWFGSWIVDMCAKRVFNTLNWYVLQRRHISTLLLFFCLRSLRTYGRRHFPARNTHAYLSLYLLNKAARIHVHTQTEAPVGRFAASAAEGFECITGVMNCGLNEAFWREICN